MDLKEGNHGKHAQINILITSKFYSTNKLFGKIHKHTFATPITLVFLKLENITE
jgi:hypothetical protein